MRSISPAQMEIGNDIGGVVIASVTLGERDARSA